MPRSPVAPSTAAVRLPAWAAACFLASGAAGLLYEVVWTKQLAYLLGNSLHSAATVVAAFLAGLALGAWLLGARLARRGNGARTYAGLELAIAAFGVASMPLLRALDPLIGTLYRGLGGEGAAFALARFAMLFVVLLPPTVLMGATLPVLVGHFESRRVGAGLARLYAINTAGAVAGSVAGGFLLLPTVGLAATTWVAAALNGLAALLAQGARTRSGAAAPDAPARGAPSADAGAKTPVVAIGVLFALSGLAALVFQIAWIRLFALLFGSSVYSFAAVLAVYLTGLALGSAWIAPRLRPGRAGLATFAWLQLGVGLVAMATLHAFRWLPEAFYALTLRAGGSWARFYAGELALVFAVLLLPCAALGAVFPLAARLLQRRDSGHATGVAYAVNTAGTLAGSLLAGFALVPALGVQGTHLAAAWLSIAVGLAALALAGPNTHRAGRSLALGAGVLAASVALALTAPRWDAALMSAGLYRPVETRKVTAAARRDGPPVRGSTRNERTLFYREGINGSVYVASDSTGRYRWLKVGGKTDASTGDMLTQVLLGVLPGAMGPEGGRAAVIGLGSGITLSGVLATGASAVDVMEIEPAVVEASRFFDEGDRHPLEDPRVTLVLGDARTHLAHAGRTWDVIVSEPSNPWIAGVNGLFTVEFYRRARAVLSREGVFCQWVQLYELSPGTLGSMLGAFLSVFPHGHAFVVPGSDDLLLVATPPGGTLARERIQRPEVQHELTRARQIGPESVAAWYACPFDSLVPLARGWPLNRDDRPIVEYRAPRDQYRIGREGGAPAGAAIRPAPWAVARTLFADWEPTLWFEGRALQLARSGFTARAAQAVDEARGATPPGFAEALARRIDAGATGQAVAAAREDAMRAAQAGRFAEARDALRHAVTLDPRDGRTWVLLAESLRQLGDVPGALAAAERGRTIGSASDRSDARVIEGLVAMGQGQPRAAAAAFRDAQRWSPGREPLYVFEVQALDAAGDRSGALAACRRGLDAVPAGAELAALRRTLEAPPATQRR